MAAAAATKVKLPVQLYGLHARYANSLFVSAKKSQTLPAVQEDMVAFAAMLKSNPKLAKYLKNPIVKRAERKQDMEKIAKGMSPTTKGFFSLLAENGRLSEVEKIISTFAQLMDAEKGIVSAKIISADKLNEEDQEELEGIMKQRYLAQGQTLRLTKEVDPELLGGFQLQVGDKFMDLSVSSQINMIAKLLAAPVDATEAAEAEKSPSYLEFGEYDEAERPDLIEAAVDLSQYGEAAAAQASPEVAKVFHMVNTLAKGLLANEKLDDKITTQIYPEESIAGVSESDIKAAQALAAVVNEGVDEFDEEVDLVISAQDAKALEIRINTEDDEQEPESVDTAAASLNIYAHAFDDLLQQDLKNKPL